MSVKSITFLVLLFIAICGGMVYYTILVTSELKTNANTTQPQLTTQTKVESEIGVTLTSEYTLPVPANVATDNLRHTIPLEEIKRGCLKQDCIASVDAPEFVPAATLQGVLDQESLGILVSGSDRFYPFPMLETHEIVNDVKPDGTPIAVTYCPLCGTGIVFARTLNDGEVVTFGVSGMLWQSNLLMYNRADNLADQNLWSQVLGQAVVGERSGELLQVLPSDIITFGDWISQSPTGLTLTTGAPKDPYNGKYFQTASFFEPDYDAEGSPIPPMTRVHGIIVAGQPKAYVSDELFNGLTDLVAGRRVFVEKNDTTIKFITSNAEQGQAPTVLSDIEGFWFSWVAAHPDTELWTTDE